MPLEAEAGEGRCSSTCSAWPGSSNSHYNKAQPRGRPRKHRREPGNAGLSEYRREVVAEAHRAANDRRRKPRRAARSPRRLWPRPAPIAVSSHRLLRPERQCRAMRPTPTTPRAGRQGRGRGSICRAAARRPSRGGGTIVHHRVVSMQCKVAGEDHVALGDRRRHPRGRTQRHYAEGQRRFYEEHKAMGIAAPGERPTSSA